MATNVQTAANQVPLRTLRSATISFGLLFGFVPFVGMGFTRRGRWLSFNGGRYRMLLFFAGTVALAATLVLGCSGSNGGTSSTPPPPVTHITPAGTSNVTVNAISSGSSGTSVTTVLSVTVSN
ncbi:hypothetical protein [Tunturiibacter gelidiferens]|uniref:hypothetical protein n=1 Tax=Tunturiibacter gelidiferens TaxID=3069689 RepID=UPI003D9AEE11